MRSADFAARPFCLLCAKINLLLGSCIVVNTLQELWDLLAEEATFTMLT